MTFRLAEVTVICNAKHTEKKLLELIILKQDTASGGFLINGRINRKRFIRYEGYPSQPNCEVIVYCTSR